MKNAPRKTVGHRGKSFSFSFSSFFAFFFCLPFYCSDEDKKEQKKERKERALWAARRRSCLSLPRVSSQVKIRYRRHESFSAGGGGGGTGSAAVDGAFDAPDPCHSTATAPAARYPPSSAFSLSPGSLASPLPSSGGRT